MARSLLDVLDAERELVETEIEFNEARCDLIQASHATLVSTGRLKTIVVGNNRHAALKKIQAQY